MPRHAPLHVRLVVLAAALAASAGCRRASGPPPERFLSQKTRWVVLVPELRRAGAGLRAALETASSLPGAGSLRRSRESLKARLGFDPLDPESLAAAGIEPSRGLALALDPDGFVKDPPSSQPLLAILPVRNAGALEKTVARIARDAGASERVERTEGDTRLVMFHAPGVGYAAVVLGFRSAARSAALSVGPEGVEAVRRALSRGEAESLGAAPRWREQRKTLGDRYAALVVHMGGTGWTFHTGASPAFDAIDVPFALGIAAGGDALQLGLAVPLADDAAGSGALQAKGDSKAALRALSPDAPLVARWDGDPAALGPVVLPAVPERDRRWLAAHGLELQKDVLDLLAPGAALSVSVSPRLAVRELSEEEARVDPLRVIRFELVAEVKDAARAAQVLARVPALAAELRGERAKAPRAGAAARSGRIATPSGELAWRLDGTRLFVAGGPAGAVDALATRTAPGWTAPTKASAAALEGGVGGAVLAPRALAAAVRALPGDAYGDDPAAFLVRAMVESYLAPLERLQAISARAELVDAALLVSLEVEAAPPKAKKKEGR